MATWSHSLIPDGDEFVDDSYTGDELDALDGNELQSLAARHPTDEVNGHSTADEIREALEGEERVEVDDG
jgi:hypothetical protein